ncbi:MAG: very short patch repair endonuclease [Pyrinomonadaceae bacterium]
MRDNRSPTPTSDAVSRVMSANRSRDTKPEITLRKALWNAGHRGYRLHYKKVPGRPDISFVGKKVAIFVNGCYWHRCPKCNYPLPKNNTAFWQAKFDRNIERDARKRKDLKALGWKVITVWECDLKKRMPATLARIVKAL